MMRLPMFRYVAPATLEEAARILAGEGAQASLLAGGTDLLPNMKRRQQTPAVVIGLRRIAALATSQWDGEQRGGKVSVSLGACTTLTSIVRDRKLAAQVPALWEAAAQIATPHLRNMGTLGGNLCLDTRCNYYDQNYEWRKAIDFCMKKDGDRCWVATSSRRCLAVSSTDTAPALMALGARIRLVSAAGTRELALADLYQNDGIHYLTRRPDEILSEIVVDVASGWKSTYWKLRRRGSFDFPVLSVAAAVQLAGTGRKTTVTAARLVIGSVASQPMLATEAAACLVGHPLEDAVIEAAAARAVALARPMDNTDFVLSWRKRVTREFVGYALRQLRGDDMSAVRARYSHQSSIASGALV